MPPKVSDHSYVYLEWYGCRPASNPEMVLTIQAFGMYFTSFQPAIENGQSASWLNPVRKSQPRTNGYAWRLYWTNCFMFGLYDGHDAIAKISPVFIIDRKLLWQNEHYWLHLQRSVHGT